MYDTAETVTAWQVQGEILNDGIQGDLAKLGVLDRHRLASLLSDTAGVLRKVPEARQVLEGELMAGMSESSHPAAREFLDKLERGGGAALLRDLPQAAGVRKPPLPAMAAVDGALVHRSDAASLGDLHRLAAPLLTTLASAARGADAGSSVGKVVATGGRIGQQGLDIGGDGARLALGQAGTFAEQGYRVAGVALAQGTRTSGELAAQWREIGAQLEAGGHQIQAWLHERHGNATAAGWRALGSVAGVVSPQSQRELERLGDAAAERGRQRSEQAIADAGEARERGQASAAALRLGSQAAGSAVQMQWRESGERVRVGLVAAGSGVDAAVDAGGERVGAIAGRAPLAGATLGGTTGLLMGGAVAYRPGSPWTGFEVRGTVQLLRQAGPALEEGLQRHGMASAMIPSLDGEIARQEEAARALLRARQHDQALASGRPPLDMDAASDHRPPLHAPAAAGDRLACTDGASGTRPLLHTGEAGRALGQFLDALQSGDAARISAASAAMLGTQQAHDWLQDGRDRLDVLQPRQSPAVVEAHAAPQIEEALAR